MNKYALAITALTIPQQTIEATCNDTNVDLYSIRECLASGMEQESTY